MIKIIFADKKIRTKLLSSVCFWFLKMKLLTFICHFLISHEVLVASQTQVQSCGHRQGVIGKIVNGIKAKKNYWPWLVAFVKVPENSFFCGGSLISVQHALSGTKNIYDF